MKNGRSTIVPDELIKKEIARKLAEDPDIKLRDIRASVEAGKVTLKGKVNACWKKIHAEDLVSNEAGVVSVENLITVLPTIDYYDREVPSGMVSFCSWQNG